MSYTSLKTAIADVSAVAASSSAAMTTAQAVLKTASATDADVGNFASALTTAQKDVRAIRADLDSTDVEALQRYEDAAVTIGLWRWERGVRRSLTLLEGRARDAVAVATELRTGRGLGYYTTRPGDTLQSIAQTYLGGWQEWPRLSRANGIKAGPVAPGTVLVIPQKV